MPQISKHYPLQALNTFGLRSQAEYFTSIQTIAQLQACIADESLRALPWHILGGGSNLVLPEVVHGLVLKVDFLGKALLREDDEAWYVAAAAGENWHDFVQWTLAQGWGGLENLSLIPGTVGACPVQNVGAYGVEIKDVLHSITALELATGQVRQFSNAQCHFAYRNSIFKQSEAGRWCITEVVFRLPKQFVAKTNYGDIEHQLGERPASAVNIAQAVIEVRQKKLPDPAQIGNAGSYFKNPIVAQAQATALQQQYPKLIAYPVANAQCKLAAGWLLETAGWKGQILGPVGMYDKQALVMVNHGGAVCGDVKTLELAIIDSVERQFGVRLEPEPIYWA